MTKLARASATVAALGVLTFLGSHTAAASPAPLPVVVVAVESCSDLQTDVLRRVIELELSVRVVEQELDSDPMRSADLAEATSVRISCASGEWVFHVVDPSTGKELIRRIDAKDLAERGTARLAGLVVVELVSASWLELAAAPVATPAPTGRVARPAIRRAARARARHRLSARNRWAKALSAILRVSSAGDTTAGGGGFRFVLDAPRRWGISLDAALEENNAVVATETIDILTASASLSCHLHARRGAFRGRLAAGFRAGTASAANVARGGGFFASGIARASLALEAVDYFSLEVAAETGYALRRIEMTFTSDESLDLDRATFALQIGVGVRW